MHLGGTRSPNFFLFVLRSRQVILCSQVVSETDFGVSLEQLLVILGIFFDSCERATVAMGRVLGIKAPHIFS